MPTVTDMIVDLSELAAPDLPGVTVVERPPGDPALLALVRREQRGFLRYYDSPDSGTSAMAIVYAGQDVGGVLLDREPAAGEQPTDGAVACLVVATRWRHRGIASAAIVESCRQLHDRGCLRVIAEWVVGVELYSPLGFRVWRTREVTSPGA